MKLATSTPRSGRGRSRDLPCTRVHTLVIGSGAAGLNAAVQLKRQGVEDVLILTEGLDKGTSINTGSDKQTYYKLSLYGEDADAPLAMAETYFAGGSMHGDLALVEASLSARAFLHLVTLGLPFPMDRYGQFVGYKTDHDPRQRATSIGPYTSQAMCRALIHEVERLAIPVREGRLAIALLALDQAGGRRVGGALALDGRGRLEAYQTENVVYATGGPGGLYRTSVYPEVHTGAIGVALLAGAQAQNLPESQYGLSSIRYRWNVSGTYMQAIPRVVSTGPDGTSEPREFLRDAFPSAGELHSMLFLKGYQWPFDSRKIGGSSLIDVLVYIETVQNGRRVYLDYRTNPAGFTVEDLSAEARTYLENSRALQPTPLARLQAMNPAAVELYKAHGIDLAAVLLEVAVCAQHNNGGLAANHWWESVNLRHLFPVGEVNGSHGIYRPGGSALNSGQVGGFRASEFIAKRYAGWTLEEAAFTRAMEAGAQAAAEWSARCRRSGRGWREEREVLQARMTRAGAHIRSRETLVQAIEEGRTQWRRIDTEGCRASRAELAEAWTTRQLCFAHLVYLEAIRFALESGAGSRGSSLVLDPSGIPAHPTLGPEWRHLPANPAFQDRVLETAASSDGTVTSGWVPRRPLPDASAWFETAWAAYREGEIYT